MDIEHHVVICRINPNKQGEEKCKPWIIHAKSSSHRDLQGCRVKSSPARSWRCHEELSGRGILEDSPSVAEGACPALCSHYRMGQNPMEVWYAAQQLWFTGGSSAPSSTRSHHFSAWQLGMEQYNRAAAKKRNRGLFSSFWLVKCLWHWSLQTLFQADNLWATWTLQTLTLGSFHKHACSSGEQIALGLDGIDQYFRQQLLNCGKGECGAHWQTEDWVSLLSSAISQHQSPSSSPWSHCKFSNLHKWDLDHQHCWVLKYNLHWDTAGWFGEQD